MTEFLVRRLIRGAQNTEDPSVREAYGRLAGIVGVACNALLFVGKFLLGTLTGSVSITAEIRSSPGRDPCQETLLI